MTVKTQNDISWLHRFIVVTVVATFLLLGSGGMVTSHEAGMSVPDWPNTYGYNMFLFPVSKWVGGVFYEHTHRLLASGIGFLTTVLAIWLWWREARVWMRWLGLLAFVLVALQGVLGGLRVTLAMDKLGIVHGALAQLFFVLMCALALFTSRWWLNTGRDALRRVQNVKIEAAPQRGPTNNLRWLVLATTILIFLQLILGATMRHQHAGLAIPDFPSAYGKIWPDTSAAAVAHYNADRMEIISQNPISAFQIILQMVHRIVALAILVGVAICGWMARRLGAPASLPASQAPGADTRRQDAGAPGDGVPLQRRLSVFWLAMIVVQIGLGAATIWSDKAADVATAHVLVGALALVTGAFWCVIAFGPSALAAPASVPAGWAPDVVTRRQDAGAPGMSTATVGVHPAMVGNK